MACVRRWGVFAPLLRLLGRRESDDAVQAIICEHGLVPEEAHGATYWEASAFGITVRSENGIVDTVFLHGDGKDDFAEYQGPLPTGLEFGCDRSVVRTLGGAPTWSSTGAHDWDRYDLDEAYVHFTYEGEPRGVSMITLGS